MRTLIGFLLGLAVLGLGFWAYQENYRTRDAVDQVRATKREIMHLRDELTMLRAEWAWLNRPERLRMLVDANGAALGLSDMAPDRFGVLDQVAYPTRPYLSVQPVLPGAAAPAEARP
ncbi:cell division protein FtsL [Mangrovicoccus algicola]|uniref:Cell division protein FtsL n=1 Tax=Mangrovicoccus algicola TaxID=2771008 RepID=A0A8J6ZA12_9RHOB|nr:cell division protein FtsL [Mangrovicoccus algicola]MBE3639125.1 cell division protein FtsL [Mangrovicoccus algicola]